MALPHPWVRLSLYVIPKRATRELGDSWRLRPLLSKGDTFNRHGQTGPYSDFIKHDRDHGFNAATGVNYGVASSSSWCKSVCNPKSDITRIKELVKTTGCGQANLNLSPQGRAPPFLHNWYNWVYIVLFRLKWLNLRASKRYRLRLWV